MGVTHGWLLCVTAPSWPLEVWALARWPGDASHCAVLALRPVQSPSPSPLHPRLQLAALWRRLGAQLWEALLVPLGLLVRQAGMWELMGPGCSLLMATLWALEASQCHQHR